MPDLFKDIPESNLFKNEVALDPSFHPKKIQFRESENEYIAECIKPLLQKRSGKNLLIYGPPGIGKTISCKNILSELEETTDDIIPFYINCWKKNTSYQIILELCDQLNYKFTQNKRFDELFNIVKQKINQKSAVFILDEADKAESLEILYNITEEIYRKSIILITNDNSWMYNIDSRIKSRLLPEILEFRPYNLQETTEILKSRLKLAFSKNTFNIDSFNLISQKTFELQDIRIGLFLLRESALISEFKSEFITEQHVLKAIEKLKDFTKPTKLDQEESSLLEIIKQNQGKTTGEIFQMFRELTGKKERTFQKNLKNLETAKLIDLERIHGIHGKSFKVTFNKKLTDF